MEQLKLALTLSAIVLLLTGCGQEKGIDEPNPNRVARKPFNAMTKDEKKAFIDSTPMNSEAKAREKARIDRGEI